MHVAGSPCTDFSSMGLRKGLNGETMVAFLVWIRLILTHLPIIIIHENVVNFPASFWRICLEVLMTCKGLF